MGADRGVIRLRAHLGMCVAQIALTSVCLVGAPPAIADSTETLRAAVVATRGAACGPPLRSDPVIDQAATLINQTTDRWLNFASRAVPESEAMPILKDLGYGGSKATILSGAATSEADAIKATLLQGWAKIPDCSYTDFGVSTLYNTRKNMLLTTVVLAG